MKFIYTKENREDQELSEPQLHERIASYRGAEEIDAEH